MINYGLENKVVLLTGGSRGLGRVLVDELKQQGSTIIFANRDAELGAQVAAETGTEYVQLDLTDFGSIEALFAHIVAKYGKLDVLINNAAETGGGASIPVMEQSDEITKQFFNTNTLGSFKCAQEAAKIMVNQETKGVIVNVSSTTASKGGSGLAAYAASKGAVNSMTYAMATEFGPMGIRINAVQLGVIGNEATKMFAEANPEYYAAYCANIPLGRVGEPEEMIKPILFLCSPDASYMQGSVVVVDGGLLV